MNTCGFHAIVNTRYGGPIDRIKYEIKQRGVREFLEKSKNLSYNGEIYNNRMIPDYKEAEKEMQQRLGGNDKGIGI